VAAFPGWPRCAVRSGWAGRFGFAVSWLGAHRLFGNRRLTGRFGTAEDTLGHADQLVGPVSHLLEPLQDLLDPVLQPVGWVPLL
jgi:hypothetical protein